MLEFMRGTKIRKILYNFLFVFLILFPSLISSPQKFREHRGIVDYSLYEKEKQCLSEALYYEARNQSHLGMKAVANVILNRKNAKGYPNTICKVVHQPYAFSYRNHLKPGQRMQIKPLQALDKKAYADVSSIAEQALLGAFKPVLEPSVLYYVKVGVKKPWMKKLRVAIIVDNHVFMKEVY